ncbi:MAG: T9SS type A sorting domain-containing protein [bacterium]
MKNGLLFVLFIIYSTGLYSQVTSPESIIWNELTGNYIISDVSTGKLVSMEKDGYFSDFTTGLSQPKGLYFDGFSIWVTDLREIVEIDAETGVIIEKHTIAGAGSLNDIVGDDMGYLYISDMQNNRIYRYDVFTGTAIVFSNGLLPSPNGIYYDILGGLIVVSFGQGGGIYSVDAEEGNVELLVQTGLGQLDGIAYDIKRDRYYISSWATNSVYIFDASFEETPQLLRSGLNGPADIFFDEESDTLIVPVMNAGQIVFIGFETEKITISGKDSVCENSTEIYRTESSGSKTNSWTVSGGEIQGSAEIDSIEVVWGMSGIGTVKIVQSDTETLTKDSAEISVNIFALPDVNILGSKVVCENNIEKYYASLQSGVTNKWTVEKGELIGEDTSDTITVNWETIPEEEDSSTVSGFVTLTRTNNITGCSNTSFEKVGISKKPNSYFTGSNKTCVLNTNYYYTRYEENTECYWMIEGGTLIGNNNDTMAVINWEEEGEAKLSLIKNNIFGCSDTTSIDILVHPSPKPVITENNGTLYSTKAVDYQWYLNDIAIQDAIEQSYTPEQTGNYKVWITDENGCIGTSDEYYYEMTDVNDDLWSIKDIYLYPVPVKNILFISGNYDFVSEIKIYNLLGKIIYNKNLKIDDIKSGINLNCLPSGIYFMLVKTDNQLKSLRLIKE